MGLRYIKNIKILEFCVKKYKIITINVPLFKKLRDIIFLGGENHFMSHFEGHFEGASTFLTPKFDDAVQSLALGEK